jgi:hypothetical protein
MTTDVRAGRRARWPRPFQAFLIANVLFDAAPSAPGLTVFETPFQDQTLTFDGGTGRAWSAANAADLGVSMEDDVATLISAAYGAPFCRRVYGDSWPGAVLRGLALPVVFYSSLITLYRPLLFAGV